MAVPAMADAAVSAVVYLRGSRGECGADCASMAWLLLFVPWLSGD